jgi:uncharacterized membrane protein
MQLQDNNLVNSLIHLYRGELGRLVSYRARLDTTTNWAVVTTAAMTTFALGNHGVSHVVFLFAMFLNYFFLHIETRRFRLYELSHRRVRLLERYFFGQMLGQETAVDWQQQLWQDLQKPSMPISRLHALGWRIRRNYGWLYAAVLLAWGMKLSSGVSSLQGLIGAAGIGTVPGFGVILGVILLYLILIVLALYASLNHQLEAD